jgi:SPW repeat
MKKNATLTRLRKSSACRGGLLQQNCSIATNSIEKYTTTARENRNYQGVQVMQKWVQEVNMNEQQVSMPERRGTGNSWVNILLGIWVIISPFMFGIHAPKGIWNNVITGVVVGVLAIIRLSMHQPGWSWLNLILGIWLVISPFVLFLSGAAMWNNVILGILICAFSLTNTYSRMPAQT